MTNLQQKNSKINNKINYLLLNNFINVNEYKILNKRLINNLKKKFNKIMNIKIKNNMICNINEETQNINITYEYLNELYNGVICKINEETKNINITCDYLNNLYNNVICKINEETQNINITCDYLNELYNGVICKINEETKNINILNGLNKINKLLKNKNLTSFFSKLNIYCGTKEMATIKEEEEKIFLNDDLKPIEQTKNINLDNIIFSDSESEEKEKDEENKFLNDVIIPLKNINLDNIDFTKEENEENDGQTKILKEVIDYNKPLNYNGINLIYDDKAIFKTCVNLEELADNSKKSSSIYNKIGVINSINDTAYLNYYKNKININENEILNLSGIFCDNILFYIITEMDEIDTKEQKTKHGDYGSNIIQQFFINHGLKGMVDFKHKKIRIENKTQQKEKTNKIIEFTTSQINKYKHIHNINENIEIKPVAQVYKISLSMININKIYEMFNNENIKYLEEQHGIYFYDIDFTQDVAGCFNKEGFISDLINNNSCFKMQNDTKKKYKNYDKNIFTDNNINEGESLILKNSKYVGLHCLTYLKNENGKEITRNKIYNKVICNLEMGSLTEPIGSNTYELIYNNKDKRLFNTIKTGMETGILRIETTYNKMPTLEKVKERIEEIKKYLLDTKNNNYFYCSISEQWQNYTSSIKENLIILDYENKEFCIIRTVNSLTNRTSGIFIDKKHKDIKNETSRFKKVLLFYISYYAIKGVPLHIINLKKQKKTTTIIKENKKTNEKKEVIKNETKIFMSLECYKIKDDNNNINNLLICPNKNFIYTRPDILKHPKFNYIPQDLGFFNFNGNILYFPDKKINFKTVNTTLEKIPNTKEIKTI